MQASDNNFGGGSVRLDGRVIVGRVGATATAETIAHTAGEVATLFRSSRATDLLLNALGVGELPDQFGRFLNELSASLAQYHARVAILVSDPRPAFACRLALPEGRQRVFYDDAAAAMKWLERSSSSVD